MKITQKILDDWIKTFRQGESKNIFSREVVKLLGKNKINIFDVQSSINIIQVKPIDSLNTDEIALINAFNMMKLERKCAIEEDLSEFSQGLIHLSKSQLGNTEKQDIKLETENLSDILKKNG